MFAHWTGLLDSVGCFLVAVEVGAEVGVVADFDCCFLVAAGAGVGVVVLAGAGAGVVADFDYCFLGCSSDSGCFVALAALAALVVLVVLGALAGGDGGDDAGAVGDAPRCGYGGR